MITVRSDKYTLEVEYNGYVYFEERDCEGCPIVTTMVPWHSLSYYKLDLNRLTQLEECTEQFLETLKKSLTTEAPETH